MMQNIGKRSWFLVLMTYVVFAFILCAGFGASFWGYTWLSSWERRTYEFRLETQAQRIFEIIQTSLHQKGHALKASADFFSTIQEEIRPDVFRAFVQYILFLNPDIQSLEWISLVTPEERDMWESALKAQGGAESGIWHYNSKGLREALSAGQDSFPIVYAEPLSKNPLLAGYDYASDPAKREVFEKAWKTRMPSVSLVSVSAYFKEIKKNPPYDFMIVYPVYSHIKAQDADGEPQDVFKGWAGMKLHISSYFERMLRNKIPEELEVRVLADADLSKSGLATVYQSFAQKTSSLTAQEQAEARLLQYTKETRMPFGDRQILVKCASKLEEGKRKVHWFPQAVFVFGCLLTLMIVGYGLLILQRGAQKFTWILSLTDELTKLYNRRGFMEFSEKQLRVAKRRKKPCLLLFGDLDHLKKINDVYGHPSGDQAIIEAAQTLKNVFRASDVLARLGGDEFAGLLFDASPDHLPQIQEKLKHAFSLLNLSKGYPYKIAMSIGFAPFDPAAPVSFKDLMKTADDALYVEKQKRHTQRTG